MNQEIKHLSDAEILRDFFDSMPRGKFNEIRTRLVDACLVKQTTFNNWRWGLCKIPMLAKKAMNEVTLELAGKEIFTITKPGEVPKA